LTRGNLKKFEKNSKKIQKKNQKNKNKIQKNHEVTRGTLLD